MGKTLTAKSLILAFTVLSNPFENGFRFHRKCSHRYGEEETKQREENE